MEKQDKEGRRYNANGSACAACRHQRKKCSENCVLAPYFPVGKIREYEAIHKVFGYSNISKMLTNLDEQARREAIKSFEWEAMMWKEDPVFGPLGAFNKVRYMFTQLWHQLCQQQQLQMVPIFEPKLMAMAQDFSLPFNNGTNNEALAVSNNVNWAPPLEANNVGQTPTKSSCQEKSSVSCPCVTCVPSHNALHPTLLQPNYMPSLTSVARPDDTVLSLVMDQPSQVRDFQYYNENKMNGQIGMQTGQGTEGNAAENIYSEGHGQQDHEEVIPVENSVIEGNNTNHTMAQNRVRSRITEFQHSSYDPLGHTRVKQDDQHCVKRHKTN